MLAATLAALTLTLALATSLSIVFLPGRYLAPWYADYLLALAPYVCLLIGALGYQRNVIAAERALSRRLGAIFDSGAIGVGLLDQQGRLIEVNQRLADFLWRPSSTLVGQRIEDLLISGGTTGAAVGMEGQVASSVASNTRRERFRLPDGRLVWGDLSLSPVQSLGQASCRWRWSVTSTMR
ncbi:MAG: PAS domain-containing protein [Candidatus Dormibacteraeota bacterium]|nr:PAS domain-containing protein [Candidatus Dormibacteraeota bacterium]